MPQTRLRWDRCRVCKEKAVAAGGMRVLRWPLGSQALRDWSTRPPLGQGNLMALETGFQERFAEDTVRHLREVEAHFSVKIKRIAIDAPSDASRSLSSDSSFLM